VQVVSLGLSSDFFITELSVVFDIVNNVTLRLQNVNVTTVAMCCVLVLLLTVFKVGKGIAHLMLTGRHHSKMNSSIVSLHTKLDYKTYLRPSMHGNSYNIAYFNFYKL